MRLTDQAVNAQLYNLRDTSISVGGGGGDTNIVPVLHGNCFVKPSSGDTASVAIGCRLQGFSETMLPIREGMEDLRLFFRADASASADLKSIEADSVLHIIAPRENILPLGNNLCRGGFRRGGGGEAAKRIPLRSGLTLL